MTGSSLSTIRRDINALIQNGSIRKIRGGIALSNNSGIKGDHQYEYRKTSHYKEKEAIGIAAQEFIEDRDIIVLLYGTTTIHVARNIDPNKHVTVITNGLDIVFELRNKPDVKVIVLGGIIDYSNNCIEGPTVPKTLYEFNPSKIILGAGGITEDKGLTNYEFLSSTYAKDVVKWVDKVILVADHAKFGRNGLTNMIPLKEVDTIVTDAGISDEYIDIFKKYGIEYKIAKTGR